MKNDIELYNEFLTSDKRLIGGLLKSDQPKKIKKVFNIRELIMLQKISASYDCTDVIRKAMSLFGGHGVIEDFSSLPRLLRDSLINELWEGPRNVLLNQIYRDFKKIYDFYKPHDFVKNILNGADKSIINHLSNEMDEIISYPNIYDNANDKAIDMSMRWDKFCHNLFNHYQDLALLQSSQ